MSPTQLPPTVTHPIVCPRCSEHELAPWPSDPSWLQCAGCGASARADDVSELAERRRSNAIDQEVLACWREQVDRDVSGGSDDGLRLVVLRPLGESEIVRQVVRKSPTLVLRIHRVESTTTEVRQALEAWLRDPPTPEEVTEWRETLKKLRSARV